MNEIAIVGASGHGKVVADLAELCGYSVVFFDDAYPKKKNIEHWPVIGEFDDLLCARKKYQNAIVAIGSNQIRMKLSNRLSDAHFNLPTLIHSSAIVSKYANVESGTVIFANVVINAFARIATNCVINTGAIVEHDCIVGNAVHLSPNVALGGGTVVEDLTWIGIGTVTRQLTHIGKCSVIGANSTIIKNIPEHTTAFGTPAEPQNKEIT